MSLQDLWLQKVEGSDYYNNVSYMKMIGFEHRVDGYATKAVTTAYETNNNNNNNNNILIIIWIAPGSWPPTLAVNEF